MSPTTRNMHDYNLKNNTRRRKYFAKGSNFLLNCKRRNRYNTEIPSTSQTQHERRTSLRHNNNIYNNKIKTIELRIAVSIICHCAMYTTVDHLTEIIKINGHENTLQHIKLSKITCGSLIKNVISPSLKSDLIKDIENKKYGIIIDELTAMSMQKHLCILIRFFSNNKNRIETRFLGLIPVEETTKENIYNLIDKEITACKQCLANCIAFASNIEVCNNVWSRLEQKVSSSCALLKFTSHSLALCIQCIISKLPATVGFLISEISDWFCHNEPRSEAHKQLFKTMNTRKEESKTTALHFKKGLQRPVWGKVMHNILEQREELQIYFSAAEAESTFNAKYKLRLLKDMLSDYQTELYLIFATPLVQEFEELSTFFQQTRVDTYKLYEKLFSYQDNLKNRLYSKKEKQVKEFDFDDKFLKKCNILQETNNDKTRKNINIIKERCMSTLKEAYDQITSILPSEKDTFKNLSKLSPTKILNQATRPMFSELPFVDLVENNYDIIKKQYEEIIFYNCKALFEKGKIPTDTEEFWTGILQEKKFEELATYALTCLINPVSNTVVENIFDLVTSVKTKVQNKKDLDAIIRIKTELLLSNKCCKDFSISKNMLETFENIDNHRNSTVKEDFNFDLLL